MGLHRLAVLRNGDGTPLNQRIFLRKDFSRSRLVGLLSEWVPEEAPASREDFAQRLSQWLAVSDAITLRAAHQSIPPVAGGRPARAPAAAAAALGEHVQRVRMGLVKCITANPSPSTRAPRERHPAPPVEAAAPDDGFAPFQQRYLDLQRQMALQIEALRGQVRGVLTKASPRLAPLAAFDAVLEQMLGAREQKLLGTVPQVLERRFDQLRAEHSPEPDTGALPHGWQQTFGKDMEAALLAELEVRLQPVTGMMEALNNELGKHA
jgi:hypothetical protein